MAKRPLSNTLKNLKFMQRGANKEEKSKKEEEVIPDGMFPSFITTKKCVVIMEGDPSPEATRGRMSFHSFNPSIDKLDEQATNPRQSQDDATCSGNQGEIMSNRENGEEKLKVEESLKSSNGNGELKRKQAEVEIENTQQFSNKSPKLVKEENGPKANSNRKKSKKHGKLDWNVLRPSKSQTKRC